MALAERPSGVETVTTMFEMPTVSAGVTVIVRVPPDPVAATEGTTAVFDEVAVTVSCDGSV
jgi:hypothetical protein